MIDASVWAVMDELEAFQQTVDNAWNVPRAEGLLLHNIALAGGCRYLVEVGTSYGFSGLFLACAARAGGGRLETFDIDPEKHRSAAKTFEKAGLSDIVTMHTGDAVENLPKLAQGVDFTFIDAAKHQTMDYWDILEPKLADRCIVTVDNISSSAEQMVAFLGMLRERADFSYCDVQVGNGFGLAVRTG